MPQSTKEQTVEQAPDVCPPTPTQRAQGTEGVGGYFNTYCYLHLHQETKYTDPILTCIMQ